MGFSDASFAVRIMHLEFLSLSTEEPAKRNLEKYNKAHAAGVTKTAKTSSVFIIRDVD
jgi:hypothetical protein